MKKIWLLMLLLSVASVDALAPCPMFLRSPSQQANVARYCPYQAGNSCCTELEIASVMNTAIIPFNATDKCAQIVKDTLCHICSEDQALFFNNGQVTLCSSHCALMYVWCGGARFTETGDEYYAGTEYDNTIGGMFTGGDQLCEYLGYKVAFDDVSPTTGNKAKCFRQFDALYKKPTNLPGDRSPL
eukprot:TRINITY_DN12928_c0_g1_i1.p1 TRINITY_DN12928_c0_g1~~TRINITY_DN12928_c0_g1_i1.p1  ORF type:complete len:186 (+),score=33.96 TRINITY_DN12928_c0_g1_i1:43-600(+)